MTFDWIVPKGTGKLRIKQRSEMDAWISSIAHSEKDVFGTCEWKVRKAKRSLMQNAYYHKVVVGAVKKRLIELGHPVSHEEAHEFLKGRFLYTELYDEKTGEVIRIPRSTAGLSKMEFSDYIADIQRFAAETLDIVIGDPNEQLRIE